MKVAREPAPAPGPGQIGATDRSWPGMVAVLGVVSVLAFAGCGSTAPTPRLQSFASPLASASGSVSAASLAPSSPAAPSSPSPTGGAAPGSAAPRGQLASSGSIAVLGDDGSLSIVDAAGRSRLLASPSRGPFLFPAWSPDGSHIAVIRTGPETTDIDVFDAKSSTTSPPPKPVVIFRSSTISPFYIAWTPDSRNVSFLANGTTDLQLRLAPADGSAPLDGSGAGAVIRTGSPFYFDWIGPNRLLAHVGVGTDALLGEIGLNGKRVAPGLRAPGLFNAPVVSADRRYVAYVRADALDGSYNAATYAAHIVVAARDGSSEHTMPEFGVAAVEFDPAGDTVASIGATSAAASRIAIPIGPLRVMDAQSGAVRTLLDGAVMSFWWSPDGRTIGALRIEPAGGGATAAATVASFERPVSPASRITDTSPSPDPSPTPETSPPASPDTSPVPGSSALPDTSPLPGPSASPSPGGQGLQIRLVFVDVASGQITSEVTVQPGLLYGDQLLPYFDQYAPSHRVWAPDSSSILVPVVDSAGATQIAVMFRNGDPPVMIPGAIGFWSP